MITDNQVNAYIESLHKYHPNSQAYETLMRFICRSLEFIKSYLPTVLEPTFDFAKRYWLNGDRNDDEFEERRIRCWEYLEKKGHGCYIEDQEDAAVRSLLCVLEPPTDSEDVFIETTYWFIKMVNKIGNDCSEKIKRLMFASPYAVS